MAKQPATKNAGSKNAAAAQQQPSTALAPVGGQGIAVIEGEQMPDFLKEKMGQQARGNENVATDDLVIPRLEIIQSVSPEVDQSKPEYLPAARAGMLMNSVTKQLYGSDVIVVPIHYTKQWLVWRDRKKGGGFFGAFPDAEAAAARLAAAVTELGGGNQHGIEVIDTPTHLCLLVDRSRGTIEEIMIPMPRTKAKRSREWNSMVKLAGGDRFSRIYRISTQPESNAKGNFFNYAITQFGFPNKAIYAQAEKVYASVGVKTRTMDQTGFGAGEVDEENTDM